MRPMPALVLLVTWSVFAEETAVPLVNAGFERGAEGWSLPAGSAFASLSREQAASGEWSLKIVDADKRNGSNVTAARVTLPAAGRYVLRGKVYPVSGSGLGIYGRLLNAAGKVISGESHLTGLGGDQQQWQPFEVTLLVTPEAKTFELWIHSYAASVVTAYLDDFELVLAKRLDGGEEWGADMETLKQRMREDALGGGGTFSSTGKFVSEQRADGTWPDIDYGNQDRARWQPAGHVSRALYLARAYAHPSSPERGKLAVREALFKAYDYWTTHRPQCPNWWYNVIGVPRTLFRLMLLVEPELSSERLAAGLEVLKAAKLGMTGQNLVWVAEVNIARGCLAHDPWVIRAAFDRLAQEIRVTTKEGIQPDASFYQHGTQLYNGGYGRGFSSDCAHFAWLARETAFQFAPEKLDLLSSYVLDGQQWMVRGARFDYSACGREISRKGAANAQSLVRPCRDLAALKTPRQAEFEAFLARLEHPSEARAWTGNKHFWRADYMTHHRPGFMASVRLTSPRTLQTETCNDENLLGAHLSDGLLYLYRTGNEYDGIFPVWDWKRLPGTTVVLDGAPPVTRNGQRGQRPFAGGVSDGAYGLAAMDFARGKLTAKKAWFFFDGEIVCLGAGIACPTEDPVITSINQCLLNGAVTVMTDHSQGQVETGLQQLTGPVAVHHEGVGYVFPRPTALTLKTGPQTGNWWTINHVYSKEPVTKDVFSLWLNHGKTLNNGSYYYLLLPGASVAEAQACLRTQPVEVLSNTPTLQAVRHRDLNLSAAAFFAPGRLEVERGVTLTADAPCLVLWRETPDGVDLAVADPTQKRVRVTLSITQHLTGEGAEWSEPGGLTKVSAPLPQAGFAGQSVRLHLLRGT